MLIVENELWNKEDGCLIADFHFRDASWELEPNAFSELHERPLHCDASKCKCPDGRKTDDEGS